MTTVKVILRKTKGGPGSGNWGHSGRPGMVGGSTPAASSLKFNAEERNKLLIHEGKSASWYPIQNNANIYYARANTDGNTLITMHKQGDGFVVAKRSIDGKVLKEYKPADIDSAIANSKNFSQNRKNL